ncbi:tail fiber domain-containing protein [Aurantimicrobium minutum]|uniref:Peptidase S74 domain-containing protein n=1 Tax=Aurantimicrobium minutum TaxID=708131 RepID=A0A173LXI7_9MICO|nr:tail fiber domain-containing protein [Aurantimicrobium minutum]BAU99610.1 Uncharacterized protein AUMI_110680 [Aurantimicrobium minutum]
MTQSSWPFEGVDTTETQYSRLLRNIGQGVNGVPGDNNLMVYADSSGMNVKVKVAGGLSQAIVRGHMYQSTAEETLVISAAASSPRIDSIVLRLDPSANSIVLAVIAGTPAASPSAPSLTQTDTAIYELLLANVAVGASVTTISAGNVTDKRTFIENVWTTANRKPAFLGLTGFNTTIGKLETFTGSTWEVVTPTSLDASVITSGTVDSARLPIVPVASGGTGSSTAASARSALGITPGNIGAADVSHYHVIGDVTNLQAALDSKQPAGSYAASSHTHDAGAIVAGTLNLNRIPTIPTSKFGQGDWNNGAFTIASDNLTGGYLNVWGGVKSTGVYNTSVTYGAYRAVWVNVDGTFGQTASSRTVKQDIEPTTLDADAILDAEIVDFRYIDAVEALGKEAPIEVGVIAEQLLEVGLEKFVYFNEDGSPAGVHYERLAVAIIPQLQKQAQRLSAIEARLAVLEK